MITAPNVKGRRVFNGFKDLSTCLFSNRDSGKDKLRLIKEGHHQEGFHRNLEWGREGQFHPYLGQIRYFSAYLFLGPASFFVGRFCVIVFFTSKTVTNY